MLGIKTMVRDTRDLLGGTGQIKPGRGMTTSVIALTLAALCVLGVLALHFPQYLTTPDLRERVPLGALRQLVFFSLLVAGSLSLANLVLGRRRSINAAAFLLVAAAVALGGSWVQVHDFPTHTPYLGVDWFIVDLLISVAVFAAIEKAFPMRKAQAVFRRAWQTDIVHFGVNHLFVGLSLLTVNFLIFHLFGWLERDSVHAFVGAIPFIPQLLLCLVVADLAEYWSHRAYHQIPFLWKFHAVHHSTETMDWLAGSRLHLLELVTTRVVVLAPLYILGFDKGVLDTYVVIIGIQATLIHTNVRLPWGPLRYLLVTPDFHHWHHSSDDEAIDKNYAGSLAFLDYLFGTAVKSEKALPEKYGVLGDYMPDGFVRQQLFPFQQLLPARRAVPAAA